MYRELAQIILAIQLSAPSLPQIKVEQFAPVIQKDAMKVEVDPLIFVSIILHESGFNEGLVSRDGLDEGLMQIRAANFGNNKIGLLVGTFNIDVGAYSIKINKEFCAKHLKRQPSNQEWLSCYQGSCNSFAHMCKPTRLTKQFEDYELCLQYEVEHNTNAHCRKIYWPNIVEKETTEVAQIN